MEKNVGTVDRIVRVVLAAVVAYFGYVYTPWLYIISLVLLGTALMGTCLLYKPFGINTAKK